MTPLVPKQEKENNLMGTQRVLPSNKLGETKRNIDEKAENQNLQAKKPEAKNKKPEFSRKQLMERERIENARLIEVLNRAFQAQIIQQSALHIDFDDEITDLNASMKQNLTFEKMKARFDVIHELEDMNDLNDATVLRKELQRHAYLLATKLYENKRVMFRNQQSQSFQIKLKNQIKNLKKENDQVKQELEETLSKLYDVDYDDYN